MTTVEVTIRISAKAELGNVLSDIDTAEDFIFKDDQFEDGVAKVIHEMNDDYRLSDMVVETQNVKLICSDIKKTNVKKK